MGRRGDYPGLMGLCPTNLVIGGKMDRLPELWRSTPKAHRSVITAICTTMTSKWTFEEIYNKVAESGIQDDDDILATTRALLEIRDKRRGYQD